MAKARPVLEISRRSRESRLAKVCRYTLLLGLGTCSVLAFGLAAVVTAYVVANGAGGPIHPSSSRAVAMWAILGVGILGMLQILRFAIADLPSMTRCFVVGNRRGFVVLVLAIGAVAVLLR